MDAWPQPRQHRPRQLLVDGVVLGDQHAQAIAAGGGGDAGAGRRRGTPRRTRCAGGRGDGLAELRLADRLDQVRRDPSSRQRSTSPGWRSDVSMTTTAPPMSWRGPGELEQREAVHARHVDVEQHDSNGSRPAARRVERGQRRLASAASVGTMPQPAQHLVEDAAVGVVVVDDQHAPAASVASTAAGRVASRARGATRAAT